MLSGRQLEFLFKMYSNGPKIVTDNLLFYLDAGNPKSYSGSGTTWTDISRNGGNATLLNGPTFSSENGGSLIFDGTNDYATGSISAVAGSSTIVCWLYRDGDQVFSDGVFESPSSAGGTNAAFSLLFYNASNITYNWNMNASTYNWNSGLSTPNLDWCMVAISVVVGVGNTPATAYLFQRSGMSKATNSVGHSGITLGTFHIGVRMNGFLTFKGKIASLQIYTKALSESELRQNYNATKGRFGLS